MKFRLIFYGCAKAPWFNDRKLVNIRNIDQLVIFRARAWSRIGHEIKTKTSKLCPQPIYLTCNEDCIERM